VGSRKIHTISEFASKGPGERMDGSQLNPA
jgi:hypothetical protein